MRVLVTGNRGFVGKYVETELVNNNVEVIGFDIINREDLLDIECLEEKVKSCDAIIHLAVYKSDKSNGNEIGSNLLAITNLLESAHKYGIEKIINVSSVDAYGIFKGEGTPKCFPITEDQPLAPSTKYGIAKKLSEEICEFYAKYKNMQIVTLRPPGVWDVQTYDLIKNKRIEKPEYEWDPFWQYGAFIDVRDLAGLCSLILKDNRKSEYRVYNVCSNDITSSGKTSLELADMLYPNVKWSNITEFETTPYKTILSNESVKRYYNWEPSYSWKKYINKVKVNDN